MKYGMFCENCGNKIEEGSTFCGICSHPVEAVETVETSTETTAPILSEPTAFVKKSHLKWCSLLIFLLLFLL